MKSKEKIISLLLPVLVVPLVNKKELYLLFFLCKMSWCLQSACHHTCHTCQLSLWTHVELWAQCLTPDNYSVNDNYLYTKSGICITRNKENMDNDRGNLINKTESLAVAKTSFSLMIMVRLVGFSISSRKDEPIRQMKSPFRWQVNGFSKYVMFYWEI